MMFVPTVRVDEVYAAGETLNQIYFTSPQNGIVIGDNGVFLITTDAGETWTPVPEAPDNVDYNSISFPTATTGYVSGVGAVLRTTDGGEQWELVYEGGSLISTSFPSEDIGYGASSYYVYKTEDGGENWDNIYSVSSCGISQVKRIFFYDESSGVLVSDSWSYVSKTTNSGNSWTYATEDPDVAYTKMQRSANGISFWGAGNDTYYSGMYYTEDGAPILRFPTNGFQTENSSYIYAMNSRDGINFIAIGLATCALSEDGGNTWKEVFDEGGHNFTMTDAAVMEKGRYAGIFEESIYLLTQDCPECE